MPRDLTTPEAKSEPLLTASPDSQTSAGDTKAIDQDGYSEFTIHHSGGSCSSNTSKNLGANKKDLSDLHPHVQTLSIADVDICVALENATFPEDERCSREKFIYRLTTCPELSLGLFSVASPDEPIASTPTYAHARVSDSTAPHRKNTLIAQVIATKCTSPIVTADSMELPLDWPSSAKTNGSRGHQEQGRTLAIHSLAALPEFKGRGLGKIVMKSYIQRMESSGIADRIALLTHDPLVGYYEAFGFQNRGKSELSFGGGGWNNMVYEIPRQRPGS